MKQSDSEITKTSVIGIAALALSKGVQLITLEPIDDRNFNFVLKTSPENFEKIRRSYYEDKIMDLFRYRRELINRIQEAKLDPHFDNSKSEGG